MLCSAKPMEKEETDERSTSTIMPGGSIRPTATRRNTRRRRGPRTAKPRATPSGRAVAQGARGDPPDARPERQLTRAETGGRPGPAAPRGGRAKSGVVGPRRASGGSIFPRRSANGALRGPRLACYCLLLGKNTPARRRKSVQLGSADIQGSPLDPGRHRSQMLRIWLISQAYLYISMIACARVPMRLSRVRLMRTGLARTSRAGPRRPWPHRATAASPSSVSTRQ